jgi:hypothetical protein
MDAILLRYLGVDEAIIQALKHSYGERCAELEIMQEKQDLKLLFKRNHIQNLKPHIVTIPGYFITNSFCQKASSLVSAVHYNCSDTLVFLPESTQTKENITINGVGLCLSDTPLKLLRHLAKKTVDTKTGWVYIQDMRAAGVISSDGYQAFSRLRSAVATYLLKKNAEDFIEANGKKQYRLAIDPKHIKFLKNRG